MENKIEVSSPTEFRNVEITVADGDKVIGRTLLVGVVHVEGTEIEPEYRSGTILKRLMDATEKQAAKLGIKRVFAYAINEQNGDYLSRLGYTKQPWTVWFKEI